MKLYLKIGMEIYCINNKKTESFNPGVSFSEIFVTFGLTLKSSPVCVTANGRLTDMECR